MDAEGMLRRDLCPFTRRRRLTCAHTLVLPGHLSEKMREDGVI
jgi:hypothetical protein